MSEKSLDEEIKIKAQESRKLARYMSSTQDLVEEQIRKARERGEFDNLKGKGQPLDLSENPYEPPDMRMAYKILKDNDFAPFWIQLGKEIDADFGKFWKEVENFRRYTCMFVGEKHIGASVNRFNSKKASFYFEQRLALEKIDKKILNYNLHCPTFRMGRPQLNIDDEMFKVIDIIEKVIEEAKNS